MTDGAELILIDSWDEAQNFTRWLGERRPILAFDVETTGLDPWRDTVRLCQFGDARTGWAMDYKDWRGLVRHVLDEYEGPLVAHNAKFDTSMLEQDGLTVPRERVHDTMTMCALHDSHGPKGLKQAATRYVGAGAAAGEQLMKQAMKKAKWDWASVPIDFEPYWSYGALDTVLTARLAETLWPRIQPYVGAYETEIAVTWVLLDMEQRGARVDVEYVEREYAVMQDRLAEIRAKYPQMNIISQTQVMNALMGEGFRFTKKTAAGNYSLDDEVLASIDHPIAADCREARRADKFSTTYFGNYLKYAVDGVVHCNVNPLGAEKTGRMSISRPSMQNIPRSKLIRDAIVPREGNKLVLTDYQAQETRLIAHFANELGMIEAFNNGVDIHTFVASMVYAHSMETISKEERRLAKECGHARNYGSGAPTLAETAGISLSAARTFAKKYDNAFPQISRFNSGVINTVREREENGYGYVISYGGRKIQVPLAKAYTGVNYLIQGSGSDALKKGLVNADRAGISEFAVLPVHDEVVWDIPEEDVQEVLREIHTAFEHDDIRVPLPIEEKIVDKWGDAYA